MMLTAFIACQNENTEILTPVSETATSQLMSRSEDVKIWDKPSENPYDLDGYLHFVAARDGAKVIYMGQELKEDFSAESQDVIRMVQNPETFRRIARTYCLVKFNGYNVSLVQVYGDGQANTYWTVYSYGNGSTHAVQNTHPQITDCGWMHLHADLGI